MLKRFFDHGNARAAETNRVRRERQLHVIRKSATASQHLIHDRVGNAFHLLAAAHAEIEGTGLVAANNAHRFRSSTLQRHGETGRTGEIPAARDRDNHGHLGYAVECLRRHDQDRTAASLLVSLRGIKPD